MQYTELKIHSYSVTSDVGEVTYRIETSVEVAGELPHTQIFVYSIPVPTDASKDTFIRIATVTDLKSGYVDRETAVRAKKGEYATSFLFRENTDLDVIMALKTEIEARINTLIQTWVPYRDSFTIDDLETKVLPTGTPTQQAQLTQAYKDARALRVAKEKEVDAINVSIATTTVTLTASRAEKKIHSDYLTALTASVAAAEAAFEGSSSYFTALLATMSANITSSTQTIAASESTLAAQSTERIVLVSELRALQTAEDNALAALVTAFPNVDPTAL